MDPLSVRNQVLSALKSIAPEVEPEQFHSDRSLREEVDLDSMDWLRLIEALHRSLGIVIPETDYQHVDTLDKLVAYLMQKVEPSAQAT